MGAGALTHLPGVGGAVRPGGGKGAAPARAYRARTGSTGPSDPRFHRSGPAEGSGNPWAGRELGGLLPPSSLINADDSA